MSFTDQKPRIATEKDCNLKWAGDKKNFRCYMCGHTFLPGDQWRWVCATHKGTTNFLVCKDCDGEDVLDRWIRHVENGKIKYWWMLR